MTAAPPDGLPCPRCRVDLVMTERAGVEIDYCPKCRGIWLDRGELDKILERAEAQLTGMPAQAAAAEPAPPGYANQGNAPPGYANQASQGHYGNPGNYGGHGSHGGHGNQGSHGGGRHGWSGGHGRRRSWLKEIFD